MSDYHHIDNEQVIERLLEIAQKHPYKRTATDLDLMYQILRQIPFLKGLVNDQLCRDFNYEQFHQNEFLFYEGAYARKFYLVLSGKIELLQRVVEEDENEQQKEDNESYHTKTFKIYSQGDSFGELAMRSGGVQNMSAKAITFVQVATLKATSYYQHLSSYHDLLYNDKIKFLSKVSLFNNWPNTHLYQILVHCVEEEYILNQIIYNYEDSAHSFYLIKEGDVQLVAKSDMLETQSLPNVHRVCIVSQYQFFGQEEIFMKCQRRTQAVCISSKCVLFRIDKKKFYENIISILYLRRLKHVHNQRGKWRDKEINEQFDQKQFIKNQIKKNIKLQVEDINVTNKLKNDTLQFVSKSMKVMDTMKNKKIDQEILNKWQQGIMDDRIQLRCIRSKVIEDKKTYNDMDQIHRFMDSDIFKQQWKVVKHNQFDFIRKEIQIENQKSQRKIKNYRIKDYKERERERERERESKQTTFTNNTPKTQLTTPNITFVTSLKQGQEKRINFERSRRQTKSLQFI